MFPLPLPGLNFINEFLVGARDRGGFRPPAWPILVLGLFIFFDGFLFFPREVKLALSFALFVSPLWLAWLVAQNAWGLWLIMIRSYFIAAQNYIVLEVIPPRSLEKTPLAMEAALAGFQHYPGESNWLQLNWQGKVRPWWSLEIASLEGQVHFYIWTRANFRKVVESALYAQYPGVQIIETQDYTKTISAIPGKGWGAWGCDFKATRADPYPIKTYVEYGLDKTQKEPEQTDPLANLIEFAGTLGKGEYLWIQYIIRVHGVLAEDRKYHKTNALGKPYTWRDEAEKIVKEIRSKTRETYVDAVTGEERPGFPNPTKHQTDTMAAIERNVSKLAFDVGIRSVYIARPEKFDPINITAMIGLFKAFSSEGWNSIKATRWLIEYSDYPWELGNSRRKERRAKELIEAYRRRQYFHEPHAFSDYKVMSTEELATLYHIPSRAVQSPALPRIESATGEAPVNLPT
jgi:hypothetical protein